MASQSALGRCCHLVGQTFLKNVNIKGAASTNRAFLTCSSDNGPEFRMPEHIPRSPTDILKALDSTISRDKTGPHYRYHDDPYLIPITPMDRRVYALARESGRKAAAWIRDQHPHLFLSNTSDAPAVEKFLPIEEYTEESEVSEEILQKLIASCKVVDAATVYRLCSSKGIELSATTKQSLLELMCYYNEEEAVDEDWVEERSFAQVARPGRDMINTWKSGGLADELFLSLDEPSTAAYCALIRGLSKHNNSEEAWSRYQEAQTAGLPLDTATFNSLLLTIPLRHDGYEERVNILMGLLKTMASKGLRPNQQTLDNSLQVLSMTAGYRKTKELSLQLLQEMRLLGIKPSLTSYFFLVSIHYRQRDDNGSSLIYAVLEELEKIEGDLPLLDPRDTMFFLQAIDVCCNKLQSLAAAQRLHALLERGKNQRLLGNNSKEVIYYRNYLTLHVNQLPMDEFMLVYNDLVPHVYAPEPPVIEAILTAVSVQGSFHFLPTLWTDMHFLINSSDRLLAALVSTMTHYVPDVSDVAQPGRSHKSKRDGQREEQQRLLGLSSERLGQRVPLSEQLARILGYVITSMEESLDERARTKNSWPAPLAGQMLSVLATCGGLKEGRHLLELVSKHATVVVGEIPADDVHKLCSAAVKQGDISTAMVCVSYVRTHDPASAPALAAEIASSGQPLEPAVRARLSVLFGNDIFAKQSSEEKGSEAISESSSSSDDSDSDSSSSDDETSKAKKASIEPAIEPKPRNS